MELVEVRRSGETVVFATRADLLGGDETLELQRLVAESAAGGCRRLVLNLEGTRVMNSTGLLALIESQRRLAEQGLQMKVCSLSPRVKRMFDITLRSHVFEVHATEEQALASWKD